jgi:hypothetical protein
MERCGILSDRGNQLREVQEENRQRQALILEIGQLRERVTGPSPASNQEVPPPDHSPAGQLPGPCSTALFRSGTERPHSGAAIRAVEERPPSRDTIAGSSILG